MEKYILFEYDGMTCVAKKEPFTQEEKLNGFYFYELEHLDDE